MSTPEFDQIVEQNDQTEARREHLERIRELVGNAYPNKFQRSCLTGSDDTISAILGYGPVAEIAGEIRVVVSKLAERERPPAELKDALNARLKDLGNVRVAGRVTTPPRGNFVHLTDGQNKLQIYCKKGTFALLKNDADETPDDENGWAAWQLIDHGDFIGVDGYLFITNTGEVSVHVEKLKFLAKAMLPMPDKMHGIADPELRRRYRYADLIASSLQVEHEGLTTREVFERRAKLISGMRRYLEDHGYIEVETPMLTPKATGAAAEPFETHHKALDIRLYARIAPELYLKRLMVGGFEKVYELNRNFRNEGLSHKHNPEFTMLEFYCAYMDVNGMMDFCEKMLQDSVQKAAGGLTLLYEGNDIDFSSFERITMKDAVKNLLQDTFPGNQDFADTNFATVEKLSTVEALVSRALAEPVANLQGNSFHIYIDSGTPEKTGVVKQRNIDKLRTVISSRMDSAQTSEVPVSSPRDEASILEHLFELIVEETLIPPTFITDYPKSISPLSKASPSNPNIAERFELFINGMEVANGFSELNDPKEQYERFVDQMTAREGGDEEAMVLDEDYIRALSYGMPPAAGIGIGIDRLTMLLTDKHSIRDVILFPHMRPEKHAVSEENDS